MNAVRKTQIESAEPSISCVAVAPNGRGKDWRGASIKAWFKTLGSRQDLTIAEFERLESKKTRHHMLRDGLL